MFIYRDNVFQTNDVDFIFSYLCHILDIYTGRNYIKSVNNLDKLVAKDTVEENVSQMDPFTRVGYDIKYRLFNKNFGTHTEYIEEKGGFKDKSNTKDFHTCVLKEVIVISHFFNDLRQQYLMTNNIEYFYLKIYQKLTQKNLVGNKTEWQRQCK